MSKEQFIFSLIKSKEYRSWFIISSFIIAIVFIPITTIWFKAYSVDNQVWDHVYKYFFISYSFNTILIIIGVSVTTLFLGLTAAWLTVFYDFYLKKIFSCLLIIPIAIPPYAVAYCYADITDKGGVIFSILKFFNLEQMQSLIPSVRSIEGAIFVLSITLFPYVYLIAKFSFANNSKKIIEAAANLGVNRIRLFFRFALPLGKPAIIAGLALVMMEAMSDFGVVHYLGINSLSVGIYKSWFGLGDFNSAARLATILFILAFCVITTESLLRKNEGKVFSFDLSNQEINFFSDKSLVPFVVILIFTITTFIIPFLWLVSNSVSLIISDVGLLAYFYKACFNSSMLAFIGSTLLVMVAAIICFTQRVYGVSFNFFINFAKIGYASPGIVIAIGVITTILYLDKKVVQILEFFNIENVGLLISGSFFILIFAYLIRFLAVAINPIEAAYQKVNKKIDFAAINLGAKSNVLFLKIHIPMLLSSFLIAFLFVFIDILKELPATLILRPFNFNTLSILSFEYASSEQLKMAAIPSLLIMLLAILPLFLIYSIFRRKNI
ncbi:iron ABC transporter permease [Alphaproteobacteria bacterium]|nr:iron ABC transporter permease [Alphaproteobacteria bacterium]